MKPRRGFHFSQRRLGKTVDVSQHILIDLAGRFRHYHQVIVIEVNLMAEVVDRLLDEFCKFWMVLQGFGEFDMLDEGATQGTVHLFGKLIAIVEAFTKSLHLVSTASQADNILCPVVLKDQHKPLVLDVVCNTHYALF